MGFAAGDRIRRAVGQWKRLVYLVSVTTARHKSSIPREITRRQRKRYPNDDEMLHTDIIANGTFHAPKRCLRLPSPHKAKSR